MSKLCIFGDERELYISNYQEELKKIDKFLITEDELYETQLYLDMQEATELCINGLVRATELNSHIILVLAQMAGSHAPMLKCISLAYNKLGTFANESGDLASEIAKEISKSKSIKKIDFSSNDLGPVAIDVAEYLSHLTSLEELSLSGNDLRGDSIKVVDNLSRLPNLNILMLGSNNIGEHGEELVNRLTKLKNLTGLSLCYNKLEKSGIYMTSALSELKKLVDLDLEANDFGESIIRIGANLSQSKSLKILNVSENNIKEHAPDFAKAIEGAPELQNLRIAGNELAGHSVGFAARLRNFKKLEKLYIFNNMIGDNIKEVFLNIVESRINYIDVESNGLYFRASTTLRKELKEFAQEALQVINARNEEIEQMNSAIKYLQETENTQEIGLLMKNMAKLTGEIYPHDMIEVNYDDY